MASNLASGGVSSRLQSLTAASRWPSPGKLRVSTWLTGGTTSDASDSEPIRVSEGWGLQFARTGRPGLRWGACVGDSGGDRGGALQSDAPGTGAVPRDVLSNTDLKEMKEFKQGLLRATRESAGPLTRDP